MPSTADIERRIKAYLGVQDVVDAMKAYAGVAVRRTTELVGLARRYEGTVVEALARLRVRARDEDDAEFQSAVEAGARNVRSCRLVVAFGSAQGLCSPFNERVAERADDVIECGGGQLLAVGRRLKAPLEDRGMRNLHLVEGAVSTAGIQQAIAVLMGEIATFFAACPDGSLTLVFSVVTGPGLGTGAEMVVEPVLPPDWAGIDKHYRDGVPPITQMPSVDLLYSLVQELLYIALHRAFLESLRSENWYRLRRLESASEAIDRKADELRTQKNYARQEEITEEMMEILSGGSFFTSL